MSDQAFIAADQFGQRRCRRTSTRHLLNDGTETCGLSENTASKSCPLFVLALLVWVELVL